MEIGIEAIRNVEDVHRIEEIQKEVWGFEDLEIVPWRLMIIISKRGGILLGAYAKEEIVGFVFGFPGVYKNKNVHCSHMLAVIPRYEGQNIGFRLKMAQKKEALKRGYDTMVWTFDPLQARNAYFNIEKLGAVSNEYLFNLYGASSRSRYYAGLTTDRLVARWLLKGERAERRPKGEGRTGRAWMKEAVPLMNRVEEDEKGRPVSGPFQSRPEKSRIAVEIPGNIERMKKEALSLAKDWREKLGGALFEYFRQGYTITGFSRGIEEGGFRHGFYILEKRFKK